MKLSNIQNAARIGLPIQLCTLLRETIAKESFNHIDIVSRHTSYPYGLCVIDAVIASQVLGETKSNNLNSMLNAGLSRIQSSLAPNVPSNIEPILKIMAPRGGGTNAAKQLIAAASKINGPVIKDTNWLNSLFTIFGINDQQTRTNLTSKLQSDLGRTQPTQSGTQPTQSGARSAQTPQAGQGTQPVAQGTQPVAHGGGFGGLAGTVGSEKAATVRSINDIKAVLDNAASNRANAAAELAKVQAKINNLMARMATKSPPPTSTTAESIINDIAWRLLQEQEVRNNLRAIIPESLRSFGLAYGTSITITEADWGKWGQRIGNFLGGARDYIANPQYASKQFAAQQAQYDNVTIAKYAIKITLDQVREIFRAKLQQAGLNPDEIVKLYGQWDSLKRQNSSSAQLASIGRKLDVAYKLFNSDQSPFIVAPPVAKQPPNVRVASPPVGP